MPLTDAPDVMEVFVALFEHRSDAADDDTARGSGASPSDTETYLGAPMAALNAVPRPFAEVFGQDQNLLAQLAEEAVRSGKPDKAELFVELQKILSDDALCAPSSPKQARLHSEYVYPVV